MNISKLTISPIMDGMQGFTRNNPSKEIASQLIKERLLLDYDNKIPRVLKKLSKSVPTWVNPECKVIKDAKIKFYV